MSNIKNTARSNDGEVAESTDGKEQQGAKTTDTGNVQKEGREKLSKEERSVKREMARVMMETVGPVNWDVDKIFKGVEKPRDVTAAVLKVLAARKIIHRQATLRKYKAAIAHCINSKPTRIPGVRTYRPGKPTLEGLSCLPVTEYDYKILQASKFFRIKVNTLNEILIELEALVQSKNNPPRLEPAERAESVCSNDEEDEGDSSKNANKRSEEKELSNLPGQKEKDSETEKEKMPSIVRCDEDDGGAESADEPVEEAVWDGPMDEVTTFTGDYLDKTKSKEERLRSFVWQVMYHVKDEDSRQCVEWMIKSMLDPPSFAKIPTTYHKAKVLELYKVILPSLHMSEDLYPVAVDFAPLCGTRRIRFNRGVSSFPNDSPDKDEEGVNYDDEDEDDGHWRKVYEEMEKEKEEYRQERARRRDMGIPSDSDDWSESDDDEGKKVEVNVKAEGKKRKKMKNEEKNDSNGKGSTEEESESTTREMKEKEADTATEESADNPETAFGNDLTSDDLTSGTEDREETSGDADDEGSREEPQEYHAYDDRYDDDKTIEDDDDQRGFADGQDDVQGRKGDEETVNDGEGEDGDVECLGDVKTIEKPAREEEKGEEDDEIEIVDVVTLDEVVEVAKDECTKKKEEKEEISEWLKRTDVPEWKKKMFEMTKKKEAEDVITLDDSEEKLVEVPGDAAADDDDDDDFHSVGSRPSEEIEGNRTPPTVPLPPLIAPLPAIPSNGTEEDGEVYATMMKERKKSEESEGGRRATRGGILAMKKEPREEDDDDVTILEPPPTTNGESRDESPASPDLIEISYGDDDGEAEDDDDHELPKDSERARSPQRPIEIAQPPTPREPERKKRKVIEDEEERRGTEEEEKSERRRSLRGKAPSTSIPPPTSTSRKKKGEKPTAVMDKESEGMKQMDGDQMESTEKEPMTAVQQRASRRKGEETRKGIEVKKEIKNEMPDEEEEVSIVDSISSRQSTRGRTPRGRTPVKQKATTSVPAKDKKSAAQKLKEAKENMDKIMAMNVDFRGSKPSTPDQSISSRTRGSIVKKEVMDDDDGAASDSSLGSRRSTRSRGRPPAQQMSSTPVLSVSKRRNERQIKIEVKEEVPDVDDVSNTASSQRKPRGRTPRAKTLVAKQNATSPTESKNKRNMGEEVALKRVQVKKEMPDGDDEDEVKIIDTKPARAKTPRGRTPAKQKATTPVAVKGRKQVDLMALVSTAENGSKPSTPEMMRIKASGDEGMSERKRSLRGHKGGEEVTKAKEVIDVEDDEGEKKEEETAKQTNERRRSNRGGAQTSKSPMKSKKIEEKKQKEAMESKEESTKTDDKPAPKRTYTRKSGPVASFTMPDAPQQRRRSQK